MGHSVLPKSTNTTRIKENIDLFDWSIPEDLLPNFNEIEQASHLNESYGQFIWLNYKVFLIFFSITFSLLDKYDILKSVYLQEKYCRLI